MADESNNSQPELSEETAALAAKGREGVSSSSNDPINPPADTATDADEGSESTAPERPANVPEKFWNAETGTVDQDALLSSYLELEKSRSKGEEEKPDKKSAKIPEASDEDNDEDASDTDAGDEEAEAEEAGFAPEAVTSAISEAREVYAAQGNLSDEVREKLISVGFSSADIDMHIAGIQAVEQALFATATAAAGSEENFNAATEWAAKNYTPAQIENFNNSVGNPELVRTAVAGLMADFRDAVGSSESKPMDAGSSSSTSGDIYTHKDEFLKDLREATESGDAQKRRDAVSKLERSKKAGTLKEVTPRSQPFSL